MAASREAVRYRDFPTAVRCLDDGIALGKEAGEFFRPLRVRRALLPFSAPGAGRPDKTAVAEAGKVVEQYGTPQDRFAYLKVVRASGDVARAAEGFAEMYESTKTMKFEAACEAGRAYRELGDWKKATAWLSRAANLTGMHKYELLSEAGESALKAGDNVKALELFTALTKCINKTEQEGQYKAAVARVAMLSKIVRKKSSGPSDDLEPGAADANLSLDEDL